MQQPPSSSGDAGGADLAGGRPPRIHHAVLQQVRLTYGHKTQSGLLFGGGGLAVRCGREFSEAPGTVDIFMGSWVRAAVKLHQIIHVGFVHFPVCKL